MKCLKITEVVLSVIFGVFALIGVIQPSVEYGVTVNTSRDQMITWDVMVANDLMSEWIEGYKSIDLMEGELNTVGSKYEVIVEHEGEVFKMVETLTAVEPGMHLAMTIENEMLTTQLNITFESGPDGGTKVITHNIAQGKSWFYRSLFPLIKADFQRQEQKHYNAFAELVDRSDIDLFLGELEP